MSSLTPLRNLRLRPHFASSIRPLSTNSSAKSSNNRNPPSDLPDYSEHSSAAPNAKVRSTTQNTDKQSSASQDENLSGDEHPAKQPDPQEQPSKTTGIGGGEEVQGGKEGMKERADRR